MNHIVGQKIYRKSSYFFVLFFLLSFFIFIFIFSPSFFYLHSNFSPQNLQIWRKIAFSWHSKTYSGKFFSTVQMIHYCRADQPHWLKSTVLMQAIASVGPEFGQAFQPSANDDLWPVIKIYYLYTGNCQRGAGVWWVLSTLGQRRPLARH